MMVNLWSAGYPVAVAGGLTSQCISACWLILQSSQALLCATGWAAKMPGTGAPLVRGYPGNKVGRWVLGPKLLWKGRSKLSGPKQHGVHSALGMG